MISTKAKDLTIPGWAVWGRLGNGTVVFLLLCQRHLNKGWVIFPTAALGQVPFADSLHCLGQGLKVRGEQELRAPRHSMIFSSARRFGVRRWILVGGNPNVFMVVQRHFWSNAEDHWQGTRNLKVIYKTGKKNPLAMMFSNVGLKDSALFSEHDIGSVLLPWKGSKWGLQSILNNFSITYQIPFCRMQWLLGVEGAASKAKQMV